MPRAYIGVGSNIDAEDNIRRALKMLGERLRIMSASTFYRTAAIGSPDSPDFVNGVVAVDTELDPLELKFGVLHEIEDALGRVRCDDKYNPRTIDLDIALYEDVVVGEGDLVLPDPNITDRAFLAAPLLELAPDGVLPGTGEPLSEIVRRMPLNNMTPLPDFTARLRQEMNLEP